MKKITRKTLKNKFFLGFIALVGWNSTFAQTITQNSDITHLGCTTSEPNNDYQACIKIGNYLYTGHWGGNLSIGIYNLTNPSNPAYITTNELDNSTSNSVYSMVEANGYLYITARYSEKLYVINYANPTNLQVVGVVNIGMLHGQINVEGNTLYLANDDAKTFEIFNISNPASPVRTSAVSIGTGYSLSVAHKSGIEYCSTSNSDIKVFNVSNSSSPVLLTTVTTPNYQPARMTVIGNYLYSICNANNNVDPPKIMIFNIGNPSSPVFQSEITVSNVSSLNYINAVGNYLYLGGATIGVTGAISIYNISNLTSPVLVAQSSSSISRSFNSLAITGTNIYATDKARHELCTYSIANNSSPAASLNFDGQNDYVSIGSVIPASSSYTKECWIKTNSIGGNNIMSSNLSAFWFWQGNIQAGHGGGFIDVYYDASSLMNTWSHVAITYNAPTNTMKMYINGNLVSQNNSVSSYGGGLIQIGAFNNGTVYNGNIDEVRIWNTARTQSEIANNMNCEIPTTSTGLLANYHFNQGVDAGNNTTISTLTDATGNYNGTMSNFALTGSSSNWVSTGGVVSGTICSTTPAGNTAKALSFDGQNDYVSIPDDNSLEMTSNFSFESWVNVANYQYGTLISKFEDDGNNRAWMINMGEGGQQTDRISVVLTTSGSWTNPLVWHTNFHLDLNTWYHIAVTFDATLPSNQVKLYINGTLTDQTSWGFVINSAGNNANVLLGGYDGAGNGLNAGGNSRFFNGKMDDSRLWNTTRTQAEIQANMNQELNGNEAGLVAYYKFNQGVENADNTGVTTLTGSTSNPHNGTLNNFALSGTSSNWISPGGLQTCPTPTATITSQTNASCNGSTNGSSIVSVSGGSSFTYSWAPAGGTTATASNLSAGTYVCSITNNCGNSTTQSVTITQPAVISSSQTLSICANQSVTVGSNVYNTTGVYTDVLTATNGCDSTVTTNLTVYPTFATSNTIVIEAGQSVMIGGVSRSTAGDYVTNLSSIHGCDSIVTTTLNVINMFAPSNLVATASSQTQIDLTWADNTNNEVGFMIERASSINGTFMQVGWAEINEISISDLDLTSNTQFCYRVVAVESNGSYSSYSSTSCASTFGNVAIAASNLTATAVSQTGINLTWSDNSSDENGFYIVSEVNGTGFNTIATVGANVTSYSHVGLTQNTFYNYKVIAFNQTGNSVSSNIGSALTFDGTPLAATNLVATAVSALDVRLTWNDVATNETAYIIQRSATSGAGYVTIATIPANSITYSDYENVVANTTYFYQVLASNTGGNIASNEASVQTLATCGYVLTNQNMNCRDASICMPVISNHTITDAIGFDFTVNYDVTKYNFDGLSINSAMINPSYAEYSTYVNPDGSIKVLVNIAGTAPVNTSFNGTGSLLCMNFTKNLNHEQGVDQISIGSVLESYMNDAILHCSNNGIVTVTKDTLAAGTLRSWKNNAALSYNVNTPSQFLITKVYGSNNTGTTQSTNFVTPDLNGNYNHNIYDGQYVKIIRDIAPSTVMLPYINGTDITMVKQIAQGNSSFLPNAYQMIAADVNMDGQVTAGDVTLIKQRSTGVIGQFPQSWNATNGQPSRDWLFVDSITVATQASFQRSTTYPAYNGTGFNKNHVPLVGLTLPVAVVYSGNCPAFTASSYRGILLGDINGNFNQTSAGGTKSLEINSIAFELDGAVQQPNCIIDVPFYAGSQIGDSVTAIDFDIEFDSTKLEFLAITYATSSPSAEQLYNQISTNRVLFTSSDTIAYEPSTLLGYIRFKALNNEIVPTDLGNILAYINGEEKATSVDGSVNCSAESGVKEVTENKNISIYPNPSKGTFNVDLTSMSGEVILTVVDFSGKMIKTIVTTGAQIEKMDVSELAKGVYMLNVNTNNSNTTYRIVKQ